MQAMNSVTSKLCISGGRPVWDADSVRFTCYPKSGDDRIESFGLAALLYPFATREVQL
jgi:hypothetical protein